MEDVKFSDILNEIKNRISEALAPWRFIGSRFAQIILAFIFMPTILEYAERHSKILLVEHHSRKLLRSRWTPPDRFISTDELLDALVEHTDFPPEFNQSDVWWVVDTIAGTSYDDRFSWDLFVDILNDRERGELDR